MATTSSANKTSSAFNRVSDWAESLKFYSIIIFLVILSALLGFTVGSIVTKKNFDHAAINSGHAQYHPVTGTIEWKKCNN